MPRMRGLFINPTGMKRIIEELCEKLYTHEFNNLDEIEQ